MRACDLTAEELDQLMAPIEEKSNNITEDHNSTCSSQFGESKYCNSWEHLRGDSDDPEPPFNACYIPEPKVGWKNALKNEVVRPIKNDNSVSDEAIKKLEDEFFDWYSEIDVGLLPYLTVDELFYAAFLKIRLEAVKKMEYLSTYTVAEQIGRDSFYSLSKVHMDKARSRSYAAVEVEKVRIEEAKESARVLKRTAKENAENKKKLKINV